MEITEAIIVARKIKSQTNRSEFANEWNHNIPKKNSKKWGKYKADAETVTTQIEKLVKALRKD